MKKKSFIIVIVTIVLGVFLCSGCSSEVTADDGAITFDVTYYDSDGTTILKTEMVEEDAIITPAGIEKDEYTFVGYFATPQMTHEFDFTAPIDGDTSIFCGFVQYADDTREFFIVGGGSSPTLLLSDWGNVISGEHKLEKSQDGNNYSITLDLYKGDEFQFVINSSWHNQRGYGYLSTNTKDGEEFFSSNSYADANTKRSNIKCLVSGNYTFVLTTYPAEDYYDEANAEYNQDTKENFNLNPYDTITWTYNGEADSSSATDIQVTYYIKGSGITNWADRYIDLVKMAGIDGEYSLSVPLRAGEEFLFTSLTTVGEETKVGSEYLRYSNFDENSAKLFDGTESSNIVVKTDGIYTFSYNKETSVLSAVLESEGLPEYDYYIKGTFGDTQWATEFNADYQLVETEEGSRIYVLDTVELKSGDEFGISSTLFEATEAGEYGTESYTLVMFYNSSSLAAAGDDNANADFAPKEGDGSNIICNKDGIYKVVFDAYSAQLTLILVG